MLMKRALPYEESKIDLGLIPRDKEIKSYEDLLWLLKDWGDDVYSRKTIRLHFAEMEFLFDIAKSLKPNSQILEIGRYLGGSTILMGTAMPKDCFLTSVDLWIHDDEILEQALEILGIKDRVELIVGDSVYIESEPESYDLIFIDGDHTYEGVKADYDKWKYAVKKGGYLVFHDALPAPSQTPEECGVGSVLLVDEIINNDFEYFQMVDDMLSTAQFVRTVNEF